MIAIIQIPWKLKQVHILSIVHFWRQMNIKTQWSKIYGIQQKQFKEESLEQWQFTLGNKKNLK